MPEGGLGTELELRDYMRVLSRRKMVVIFTVLVVVGMSLLVSFLQEPIYQATARLLLQARASESPFDPATGQRIDPDRALATEIEVLKSERPGGGPAPARLGAEGDSRRPSGAPTSSRYERRAPIPKRAADVANAYATAYINLKRKQSVDGLLTAGKEIQEKVNKLREADRRPGRPSGGCGASAEPGSGPGVPERPADGAGGTAGAVQADARQADRRRQPGHRWRPARRDGR